MACVGDRVQAGVMISNSEVGLGAVTVQPLVYTLACTNGMVVNSLGDRKTHVGRAAKGIEDFGIISDETKRLRMPLVGARPGEIAGQSPADIAAFTDALSANAKSDNIAAANDSTILQYFRIIFVFSFRYILTV